MFESEIGYSGAVVDGEWIFRLRRHRLRPPHDDRFPDVAEQAEQCLRNIREAPREAGAGCGDIVRVRYILPRADDFEPCWPVPRRYRGDTRPAATMLAAGLIDPRVKTEIEVTARKR